MEIPADGILIESSEVISDESSMTGFLFIKAKQSLLKRIFIKYA
jgi:hypothetical protein